ncbi:MAG TPA: SMP-30/gluconolactonase/LRE family protein [Acidiphilium sp.]|nr:MAG: gluconolactonase [Acidiphilium sp. 21-60-14]OYV89154.1 MAG: gluconolactonase [Acidiphilium sp. 37-60-79]OZB40430.1 MAG: gluconolactonase [Acidiphilium sp. 34-60-192]HQT89880.1 SMP-30/gluconolactonase/LRE family protein [Acidiphilium sp.]HQU25164.1 SMP-30/gluconolactonase/LRE family protein [Acidiphilium sp.]
MGIYQIAESGFSRLVLPNAQLETLATGCRWLEGPIWFADAQMLLFSDIPNNRVMRWVEGGVSVFREPADFANGHARDLQGRLISCSHQARCITRTEQNGSIAVLATRYQGKRLNSPNDVIVKRDGTIWFTDPHYGINTDYEGGRQTPELPAYVYRLNPISGELSVVADQFAGPNGLVFSPDEHRLYVCESGAQFDEIPVQHIRVFDVGESGRTLHGGAVFHKVEPGFADGITCDEEENIWSSAGDGVHCIGRDGTLRGKILTGGVVANLTFGGRHRSRLFICAGSTLYAIYTNTRGVQTA